MAKFLTTFILLISISGFLFQQPTCATMEHHEQTKSKLEQQSLLAMGKKIRQERLAKQIDSDAFAAAIGVSEAKLEAIESGDLAPKKEIVYKIEAILGVTFFN